MIRVSRAAVPAVLAAALLAGCGPLVQIGGNAKAPPSLLALRATAAPPPAGTGSTDPKAVVLVLVPAVPGILQTLRQPVQVTDTSIEYLTGAEWAEQPNREFQRVLADTIAAKGIPVLDPRQSTAASGRTLSGTLLDFTLDVRNASAPVVHVRYDAALTGVNKVPFAIRRFDATVPVTSQNPAEVAIALNTAANTVAADVAAWIAR